ncbi:MAG: deoxyribose-phosphate aldolase [Alkalispirochaeta sp.]
MNYDAVRRIMDATRAKLDQSGRMSVPFEGQARVENKAPLPRYFDHTLLKVEATLRQYEELCDQALELTVRSVCVPPNRVTLCARRLEGTGVEVCTVVGFPFGYHSTSAKVEEVRMARGEGATEFDMVIPIGRLKDGGSAVVYDDVRAVVDAAEGMVVKAILEAVYLTDEEKTLAGTASIHAGAAILTTSAGVSSVGAITADVALLRMVAGEDRGVKAAGGIGTFGFATECIAAGADRLGASATVSIVGEAAEENDVSEEGEGRY